MASLETISPDVIQGISAVLEEKLKPVGTYAHNQAYGGIRAVAELLNRMDRRQSRAVLEKIDDEKPEVANSIRELMFVFEDIAMLDDAAIREILQRVDKKDNRAGVSKEPQNSNNSQFFRNMSGRAVEMMKEEMEIMGPVKIKDVHAAQQRIVEVVRKLEEEGVINLGGGGGARSMSSRIIRGDGRMQQLKVSASNERSMHFRQIAGACHGGREASVRAGLCRR